MQTLNNDLKKLENILQNIQASISQANRILAELSKESDQAVKDIPGIEGTFDGIFMNAKDGKKIEVPVNYAAKSRLVYGDTLKMIKVKEEDQEEKTLFKQLSKVPRKRIEGVLSKKDGKWYLLTESNSYRILDRAAEFNGAQPNDIAFGLIPEGNMVVPFASLDSIKSPSNKISSDIDKPSPIPAVRKVATAPRSPAHRSNSPKPGVGTSSTGRGSVRAASPKKEFISDLRSEATKPVEKVNTTISPVEEDDLR